MAPAPFGGLVLLLALGFGCGVRIRGVSDDNVKELQDCAVVNRTLSVERWARCGSRANEVSRLPEGYSQKPILITGTGGSGTHAISTLFRQNNIDIPHETIGKHGSVSWVYAVHDLHPSNDRSCKWLKPARTAFNHVFHLTRCPLDIIASQTAWRPNCGKAGIEPNFQYMAENIPLSDPPPRYTTRARKLRFLAEAYNGWTDMIDSYVPAERRFRIEDQSKELYKSVCAQLNDPQVRCRIEPAMARADDHTGDPHKDFKKSGHRKHRDLTWAELAQVAPQLTATMREKAIAYGYGKECTEDEEQDKSTTRTPLQRRTGMCSQADRTIAFSAHKMDKSEILADKLFQMELSTAIHPTEVLFTSRHRQHLYDHKEYFKLPVPKFMRMFDWYQLGDEQNLTHRNPKTVLCRGNKLDLCWNHVSTLQPLKAGETRLLAIGQEDTNLSGETRFIKIFQSSRRFSRIIFEAKDVKMPGVGTFPIGLNDLYVEMNGPQNIMKAVREASLQKKDKHVLAAWGKIWGVLDAKLTSRMAAQNFTDSSCFVNRTMVDITDYWEALSEHRFLLAPSGSGVQSPKVAEALMVLTIPIVDWNPAWEDMVNDGWPMVLVDDWNEITPAKLVQWYAELSPKLHAFRLRLTASGAFRDIMKGM
eukprot:CAMPEP_0171157910 /NCGR_PEP_ID=MMETSP0790-20130122/2216_1 /TAXON_ID=2925 /ORGANISM="Alexandrium catenella, Strain OF101" /LENGTH=645 /DNA_ID=CAMNT_0011622289 /DNA_START=73 /DNA_END=2010 /DNA_ORIENTATION=+